MSPVPADRPQYAGGAVVPEFIDETTRQWSRGLDPVTGAKTGAAEAAEPVPTVTAVDPDTMPAAAGQDFALVGDNFGGSTGVTVGGVACTDVVVVDERNITAKTGAGAAGAGKAIVVQNPAGNSTGGPTITLT